MGVHVTLRWSEIEPTEGQFNWQKIDSQIAKAQLSGKVLGLSLYVCDAFPVWLKAKGVTVYDLKSDKHGGSREMILPWDSVGQTYILRYIKALTQHVDGKVNYVVAGGIGYQVEISFPSPDDTTPPIPLSLDEEIAAWTKSANTVIDAYGAGLKQSAFVLALNIPFGKTSQPAVSSIVARAAAAYGKNFGLMQWGLNANSTDKFFLNALVKQYSPTNPVGFQLTGNSHGTVGGDLQGTIEQAINAGIALKAQFIEVYPVDCRDPAFTAVFTSANKNLATTP